MLIECIYNNLTWYGIKRGRKETNPDRVGSEYDENDEVEKLDDTTKGVDGDEKKSVGFEEGIAKPKG